MLNDGKLGVLLRQDRISNPNKYFLIPNFLNDGLNFPVCFRNEIHSAWDWFFLVLDYAVFELFARKKEVYAIWCTQKLSKHFAKQMRENCTHSDRIANTTKHIHGYVNYFHSLDARNGLRNCLCLFKLQKDLTKPQALSFSFKWERQKDPSDEVVWMKWIQSQLRRIVDHFPPGATAIQGNITTC